MAHEPTLSRGASIGVLVAALASAFVVAAVGGLATAQGVQDWYPALDKPPWTPPDAAFGPVWTVLYTGMAVALWDVVRRQPADLRPAVRAWIGQLALNLVWSPVFFAIHRTGLALLVMTALGALVVRCIRLFWPVSRAAGALMGLYLAWLAIAWSLNAWVWVFNP